MKSRLLLIIVGLLYCLLISSLKFVLYFKCFYFLALSISALCPGGVGDHRLELGVNLPVARAVLRCHLTVL